MNKIYLAMDDSTEIVNIIKLSKKKADISNLEKNRQAVTDVLKDDFYILIVDEQYVDAASWPEKLEGAGEVFILNENKNLNSLKKDFGYIHITDLKSINQDIMDKLLSNSNIVKEKKENHKPNQANSNSDSDKTKDAADLHKNSSTEENPAKDKKDERVTPDKNDLEPNKHGPVILEDYPSDDDVPRAQIEEEQKRLERLKAGKNGDSLTIGVWSPSGGGTTTFVISFAIFMAQAVDTVSVIEMPNTSISLYDKLFRFKPHSKEWVSYFEHVKKGSNGHNPKRWNWKFNSVMWYPIGPKDSVLKTENETLHQFDDKYFNDLFENAQVNNKLVLVDIPSQLDEHAKYVISQKIDMLWILMDESLIDVKSWRDFIHSEENGVRFDTKLIFVGEEELAQKFNTADKMASDLDIPLLTSIPYLDREIRNNIRYEKRPPNENPKIKEALYPVYYEIANKIFSSNIVNRLSAEKGTKFIHGIYKKWNKIFNHKVDSV